MLKFPEKRNQLSNILILIFVFFLGYLTSNVEAKYWYSIEINAMQKQLGLIDCGEMTIPEWRKQRDRAKKKTFASFPGGL